MKLLDATVVTTDATDPSLGNNNVQEVFLRVRSYAEYVSIYACRYGVCVYGVSVHHTAKTHTI